MWQTKPEREQKEETKQSRWGFRGMSVRNWLELLIVPMVLVGIGLLFEMQQAERQEATEKQQQELAEQRAQDEALQAYLNQMSTLLLEKDLRNSEEDSEERTLARARTLTVLGTLDPSRKTALMQFLVEADLVQRVDGRDPIISLTGADLSEVDLNEVAIMPGAVLSQANLSDANLRFAYLYDADLYDADLSNANLYDVDLSNAMLRRANLSGANLTYAALGDADLSGVVLVGADLSRADLSGAEGITNEELEQQASSLEGATMPNGQKYEDWLKDREKRQQDE